MLQILKIVISINLLLSSSFLFANAPSAATALTNSINIEDAYIREVPPGLPTSAMFLVLKNNSADDIALIKITGDIAKNIELHQHLHKNGMMEMRQVEKINIPAKGETKLEPGGHHIMLIGLTTRLKAGDSTQLTFEFNNGTQKTIDVVVKKIMQGMRTKNTDAPAPIPTS